MDKNKLFAYLFGSVCAATLVCGGLIYFFNTPASTGTALIIICLSLCSGLLLPNPISFFTLIAGVCMLVLPAKVTGIIFMILSTIGLVANFFLYRRTSQNA